MVHVLDVSPAVLHLEGDRTVNTREFAESDRARIWELAEPILEDTKAEVIRVERDGNPGKTLIAYCDEAGGRCWWSDRGVGEEWADGCLARPPTRRSRLRLAMCWW